MVLSVNQCKQEETTSPQLLVAEYNKKQKRKFPTLTIKLIPLNNKTTPDQHNKLGLNSKKINIQQYSQHRIRILPENQKNEYLM